MLSTSLAWPAVAICSRAETFSQLSSNKFTPLCTIILSASPYVTLISFHYGLRSTNPPWPSNKLLSKKAVIWVVQWPCLKVQRYRRRRSKRYRAKFQLQQRERERPLKCKTRDGRGKSEAWSSSYRIKVAALIGKATVAHWLMVILRLGSYREVQLSLKLKI